MSHYFTRFFGLLVLALASFSNGAAAAGTIECTDGYIQNHSNTTILFVNGIFNDESAACRSSAALRQALNGTIDSTKYNFDYIWNPNSWKDYIELIQQESIAGSAIDNLNASGVPISGESYYKELGRIYYQLIQSGDGRMVVKFTKILHDYIDSLLASGQHVLVVPHSQGNHFIESAYALFSYEASLNPSLRWRLENIRVVGAANVAHSSPNGRYITIGEDRALFAFENEISLLGNANGRPMDRNWLACTLLNVLACTLELSYNYDQTLHGFIEIYLNPAIRVPVYDLTLPDILGSLVKVSLEELALVTAPTRVVFGSNNHSYESITCGTWSQCRDAALAKGGNLVTIRSQAESDWLQSTFGTSEDLWIGMYFDRYVRELKWASGEPVTFERWGDNKNGASVPGGYPEEYCVYMNATSGGQPGYWNDVDCGNIYRKKAIIEYLSNGYQGKISWDLAGDFTTRINPSGVWSFGYRNNALATIQPLSASKSNCSDIGLTCWVMSATAPDIPLIGANLNDSTLVKRTIVVAPNEVVLHPGQNGEQAVVTWKSPAAGTYRIKGAFQVVDNAPSGVNVAIDEGLASIYSVSLGGANRSGTFDFNRQFMKDEAIYFSVDAAGNYGNDSTALSVTVTKVAGSGAITVLANTIPGATVTVPSGASSCSFVSTGTWSAGPQAPPQYQNADGVIGGTSYNLTNFGVPIPSAPNMALVVKHSSSGNWDLLGSNKTISVVAGETLSFMMNDATTFGYTDGNTGQLSTIWSCN